jgi:hypothetical protein
MMVLRFVCLLAIVLGYVAIGLGTIASYTEAQSRVLDVGTLSERPIAFFVARGAPNACGPGCSEWIAAEGTIDSEAVRRFRDFVEVPARRDLPIFFHSNGGNVGQSITLGDLLHGYRMTAGIARTIPESCHTSDPMDDACWRTIQSKSEHRARLVTENAGCYSACVYAFVGASQRRVSPGVALGVHAARAARIAEKSTSPARPNVELFKRQIQRYLRHGC